MTIYIKHSPLQHQSVGQIHNPKKVKAIATAIH